MLVPVVQLLAAASGPRGGDWYGCTGVSSCTDAVFNGSHDVPFLGEFGTAAACQAACEAMPGCVAYCGSGPSPHISPSKQNWARRCYGRRNARWQTVKMADEFSGCSHSRAPSWCPDPSRPPRPPPPLVVDAGQCLRAPERGGSAHAGACRRASRVGAGILLSINETHPRDAVVRPLRLGAHRGDWDHLPAQFERLGRLGIRTRQVLLPDLWVQAVTGHNWFTSLNKVGDWPGDEGNWTRWEAFVQATVAASPSSLYYDVWNEPGFGPGYFWNRNHSQYLEMWSRAVRVARRVRPGARMLGPSTSSFDVPFITDFLANANRTGTLPDVLSWHEFSADGSDIPANVATARALLARYGIVEQCEISINEMVPAGSNFVPAVHISYFANLERAAVDSACHSCWGSPCPPGAVPAMSGSCYNCGQSDRFGVHGPQSLDGLLSDDGLEQPRSVWWAYKAYGAVNGTLLVVNSTVALDGVAAFDQGSANGDAASGETQDALLSLVLGVVKDVSSVSTSSFCGPGSHGGGGSAPVNITVTQHAVRFHNLSTLLLEVGGAAVSVAVVPIPNSGAATVLGAPQVETRSWPVVASAATVSVGLPSGGAAALVLLGRGARAAADAFATAPAPS